MTQQNEQPLLKKLASRRILLGISGGIAAYKSAELVRRLQDAGADVRVVMTRAAQEFITPLTLQALSGNPVHTSLLDPEAEAAMGHIELARWADLICIAPATADVIARIRAGMADDLLTTLCLASKAPKVLAPAMNQAMWSDTHTQQNINALAQAGYQIAGPAAGSQACGDVGFGRMLEPEQIRDAIADQFGDTSLTGKHVVITAGPTREAFDPVRFISNHSSGKMGFELARAASHCGARVTLIAGPVNLPTPDRVERCDVISADDMHKASLALAPSADIFIGCAAVADYRPAQIETQKIKKSGDTLSIELVKNPDIIADVARQTPKPFCVGFAAETNELKKHATGKLTRKGLDLIIANDVSNQAIGFNSDDNAVTVYSHSDTTEFSQCSKAQLANQLIELIATHLD
ncbi:Coenzyme A biosynthesis bifunctional protein CoaBC [BD1-7 clade bacterium]|uniref:Coenzyme A biosynthesis bifunctional protein CoaBC n=1 Tax=BD1-7 clade bacterium TaxID=2029982 RepID=A0A5S9QBI3_9GAMM|nr:Coenzyme A biosynthesis bifunctional protein CoaBC [BD1-7 clade bacterium]